MNGPLRTFLSLLTCLRQEKSVKPFFNGKKRVTFNLMIVKGKCSFFISSHNLAHFYDDIFFSGLKLLKFSNQHLGNAVIVLLFFIDTSLLTENMLNWD